MALKRVRRASSCSSLGIVLRPKAILRVNSTAEIPRQSRSFLVASTALHARGRVGREVIPLLKNARLTGNARSLKCVSMNQTPCAIALMRLAVACLFLVNCNQADAQTTTEEWKAAAIKKYPTLNLQGSTLNKRFLALYNERLKSDPDFIKQPDWMMKMADELVPKPPKPHSEATPIVVSEGKFDDVAVPFNFPIEDTKKFFNDFIEKGSPKNSDQFETRAEREARFPKSSVYYFEIEIGKVFSYKIDQQKLTFYAGFLLDPTLSKYEYGLYKYKLDKQLPLWINSDTESLAGQSISYSYYLFLVNGDKIAPSIKVENAIDKLSVHEGLALSLMLPRDTAKTTSENLALICGIKCLAYDRSFKQVTGEKKPTIGEPQRIYLTSGIEAELVSLHLINEKTKQQLLKWTP